MAAESKSLSSENELMLKVFKQIEKEHAKEIQMIYVMSFSPSGLFMYDLEHIKMLNQEIETDSLIKFGEWDHFLNC